MNGQLHEHPLAELIREIAAAKLSGALRLAHERVKAVVYARAGAVIYAGSNLRTHRLVNSLRRWGVLEDAQWAAAKMHDALTDEEVRTALSQANVLTRDALDELLARQTADVLRPLLLWTDGIWNFEPRARLAEGVTVNLDVPALLLEAARRLPPEYAAARLADNQAVLAPVGSFDALTSRFELLPREGFVLSRVDSSLRVSEIVSISGLPEVETRHTLYALALGGLLHRDPWPTVFAALARAEAQAAIVSQARAVSAPPDVSPAPVAEAAAAAEPRAEIDSLFAHVNGARDFYEMLGAERDASPSDVKRAYYALAKRFHPDRLQRHADDAMRGRIGKAFTDLTEAYETLFNPQTRTAYDAKLGALAQGQEVVASSIAQNDAAQRHAEENFQRGLAAMQQRDHALARKHFGEAVRLTPQQPRYRAQYGHVLAADPRTQRQAEVELQAACALDANNASYRVLLAELYSALNQTRRAAAELERALAVEPRHAQARALLERLRAQGMK